MLKNKKRVFRWLFTNKRPARICAYFPQWLNWFLLDKKHKSLIGKQRAHKEYRCITDFPRIAFVILQYNHHELTEQCVESLERLIFAGRIDIVIIDNCSTDGSLEIIDKKFFKHNSIHVIKCEKNLGYARGNNKGYTYAKYTLGADFIVMINSDISIDDHTFIDKITHEYRQSEYSILGPDIVVDNDAHVIHQNPLGYFFPTRDDIESSIDINERKIKALERGVMIPKLPSIHGKKKKDKYHRTGAIVLHGAAYVFSPIFVNDFDEPFDPRTFLYGEEEILCLRVFIRGHKIVYTPNLVVKHKAKASTDKANLVQYYIHRYKRNIESARIYLYILEEENLNENP